MSTIDPISVTLSADQWRVVQMALDTQYYEDEHRSPGGLVRKRRRDLRDQVSDRLARLVEIDQTIADSTGLDPMFS